MGRLKLTDKRKELYLVALRATGLKGKSAEAIGMTPEAILNHIKSNPEFEVECKQALNSHCDIIESEIFRRAITGNKKPVYYQGAECGYVREYSDRMLELYAKRHIPEYRDKHQVDMNVTGGVLVVPELAESSQEWEKD